jgi:hypothetical protein
MTGSAPSPGGGKPLIPNDVKPNCPTARHSDAETCRDDVKREISSIVSRIAARRNPETMLGSVRQCAVAEI